MAVPDGSDMRIEQRWVALLAGSNAQVSSALSDAIASATMQERERKAVRDIRPVCYGCVGIATKALTAMAKLSMLIQ